MSRRTLAAQLIGLLLFMSACGSDSQAEASRDASVDRGADTTLPLVDAGLDGPGQDAKSSCSSGCGLVCDPADTWLALATGAGTALGDADPATPDEVGDDKWHLFVGVNLANGQPEPYVLIFDATADTPAGPYTLGTAPLSEPKDGYDVLGKETPAYFRANAHTEYVYYCAIASYLPLDARIAALKRVDYGPWTKVGPVAEPAPDEIVQCEPDVVRDAESGKIVLLYQSLLQSAAGGSVDLVARTSNDPESFEQAGEQRFVKSALSADFVSRPALSRDPVANVWRFAFDIGYPKALATRHSWSEAPVPSGVELSSRALALHDGTDDLHPELHTNAATSPGPQGSVLQPSSAIYPSDDSVVFFYSGWSAAPRLQVNGQRCKRTP